MDRDDVFLSYSHRDADAAARLRLQLEQAGFRVFQDLERIRPSDAWLGELQEALAACRIFVVLVGEEGVRRWVGAEVDVALERYIAADGREDQIALLPVLLDGREPRASLRRPVRSKRGSVQSASDRQSRRHRDPCTETFENRTKTFPAPCARDTHIKIVMRASRVRRLRRTGSRSSGLWHSCDAGS